VEEKIDPELHSLKDEIQVLTYQLKSQKKTYELAMLGLIERNKYLEQRLDFVFKKFSAYRNRIVNSLYGMEASITASIPSPEAPKPLPSDQSQSGE
jgi:hypothetical protein